jgi:hypothetical protein
MIDENDYFSVFGLRRALRTRDPPLDDFFLC